MIFRSSPAAPNGLANAPLYGSGPTNGCCCSNEADETDALSAAMETALGSMPHSLVDVSHRQVGVEVSGPGAATLINAGCPLDLDLRAFPVDMSTRTVLAKADITLWRLAEERFRIEVARSFSPYLLAYLNNAADG